MSSNIMDDSGMVELTGNVMIVSIIALFVVVIFVLFLHLCGKWFWYRREQDTDGLNNRRRGGHFGNHSGVTVLRQGLEESFLETVPVIQFDPKDFKEGILECAVCLSELEEGEKARILPKCNHGFHVECIDMWFYSHSTCPICRNPVSDQTEISLESLLENLQTHNFPTNVLFWGNETEVNTLTSQLEEVNTHHQAPVLPSQPSSSSSSSETNNDITRQMSEDEDQKTPAPSRMRSLRRILSSSRRFINPFSNGSTNV